MNGILTGTSTGRLYNDVISAKEENIVIKNKRKSFDEVSLSA